MIKVTKNYEEPPPAVLLSENCIRQIKEAVEQKSGNKYSNHYYRNEEVLSRLKKDIYRHKCAYCESKIEHAASLQVEHFRPKGGLEKEKTGDENHKGYYWLGNEWTNLLLSCPKCNGKDAKGNRFPISGVRVYDDSPFDSNGDFDRERLIPTKPPLENEMPLLLNPEFDKPEEHLEFNSLGQIKGITERGDATIEICKLDRDELYTKRQEVVNQFVREIKFYLLQALKKKQMTEEGLRDSLEEVFNKIVERTKPEAEYSSWGSFIFKEFEYCILSRIAPAFRGTIREIFEEYSIAHL